MPRERVRARSLVPVVAVILATAGVALLVEAASLAAQEPALEGCYDLEIGPWTPAFDLGVDSLVAAPPARVELRSGPDGPRSLDTGGMWLETTPGALPSLHEHSYWLQPSGDTVRLVWTTGFSGLRMDLSPSDGTLRGEARTMWDFSREPQTASAEARPVACDAPIPEEDRFRYGLVRGLQLASGDSIRIDEPLPSGADGIAVTDDDRFDVDAKLALPFRGGDNLTGRLDEEGHVRSIYLRVLAPGRFEELLDELEDHMGNPHSETEREMEDGSLMRWASWHGRILNVRLVGGSQEGDENLAELEISRTTRRLRIR